MAIPRVQAVRLLIAALRFLVIALLACPVTAFAGTAGSVLISLGKMTGERWDDGEPQLGIDLSLGPHLFPLQLAVYAAASRWTNPSTADCDGCGPIDQTIGEAGAGVRGVWRSRVAHVSLGAGPAWSQYHVEETGTFRYSATHRGTGWWAGGDALIRAGSHLGIGGGARYSRIEYGRTEPIYAWSYHGSIGWLWSGGE